MTMSTLSTSPAPFLRHSPQIEPDASPSILHRIARFVLLTAMFLAPWPLGAVNPWAWASLASLAFLALILWTVGCVHRGTLTIVWSPLYWPFLGLLLVALVQFLFGLTIDPIATREAILKLIANLVLFFLAGQLLNARSENGRALGRFGLLVTILALAVSVLAWAQFFYGEDKHLVYWSIKTAGWPFGPYVNHNNYGGLMEMLIPISVGYILTRSHQSLSRFILWGVLIVALVSVWASGSRGATAALLIEGLVYGIILVWRRPQAAWSRALPVMVGVVIVAALLFTWLVRSRSVSTQAWSIFNTDKSLDVTLGDRFWVAKSALRIAAHHPWIGVGVGCFEQAFPMYAIKATDQHWTHAHDDFAEALAETGLPGVVLLAVALVLFFRVAFRHLEDRLHHEAGWIQLGAAVGCLGLMAHSFVDFNLRIPANAAWFVVCLAIAVHPRSSERKVRKIERVSSPMPSGGFLT